MRSSQIQGSSIGAATGAGVLAGVGFGAAGASKPRTPGAPSGAGPGGPGLRSVERFRRPSGMGSGLFPLRRSRSSVPCFAGGFSAPSQARPSEARAREPKGRLYLVTRFRQGTDKTSGSDGEGTPPSLLVSSEGIFNEEESINGGS